MSEAMMPFAFNDQLVRVAMLQREPWFVAADVCRAIELKGDAAQNTRRLPDDEKGLILNQTLGGMQDVVVVSEPGLYRLVFRSSKPVAEKFRRWVFHEVLPALRRTGRYQLDNKDVGETDVLDRDDPGNRSDEAALGFDPTSSDLGPMQPVSMKARLVEIAERISGKLAARQLWAALGLPPLAEPETLSPTAAGDEVDPIALFAREGIERARGVLTPASLLFPAFKAFLTRHDLIWAGTEHAFATRFGRMGFAKRKIKGRHVYLDIRPKQPGLNDAGQP